MKQEFGEVEEPVPPGTVGSSTMPQKRNPKLSQDIIAAAAQIRAPGAAGARRHADRARGRPHHQHHDEPRAWSRACELTGDMLQRMIVAVPTACRCSRRACARTSDLSGGLIMAEALMLELGKQIGRQRAHDAVYDAAQASVNQSRPFREMLAADRARERAASPQAQVDALLDPARYTGLCRQFAERGAATARKVAASLPRSASSP